MKTTSFLKAVLTALIFTISLTANSYSNVTSTNCKYCDEQCIQAGCCKDNSGNAEGNMNGCSDKCTNEKCKDCCAGGNCSSMSINNSNGTGEDKNTADAKMKSCCMESNNSSSISNSNKTKDCCK